MGTFEAFRENGFPTYYPENKTPWEADILTSGLIFAFITLAFSLFIILPGFKGKEKLFLFIRITISLFIGGVIIVTNFTQTWETAETYTRTKYKAGTGHDVNVTVGVQIGLKGVNITLKGDKDQLPGEIINYNEHFSWDSPQGRLGFGPYAGVFNQEYRAAQFRGLPLPILWVAEYFTIDGEGIRWGRIYRQAGFYAHIMLWLSFPLWILSNVLFFVLLRFGAYMLALTGLCLLTCNIIWAGYRNFVELAIPFTAHDVLKFSFGPSFWVVLFTGLLCVILGVIVFVMDKLFPNEIAIFFGVDVLQDSESLVVEEEDESEEQRRKSTAQAEAKDGNDTQGADQESSSDDEDDIYYQPDQLPTRPQPQTRGPGEASDRARAYEVRVPSQTGGAGPKFRSSESRLTKRFQRPRRRDPPPRPPSDQFRSSHLLSPVTSKLSSAGAAPVMEEPEEENDYQNAPPKKDLENGKDGSIELKDIQTY